MLNKNGGKVRLTFKLELDQLWIGTKDRTEKIGMNSIKSIVNEPIEGHEEYHIVVSVLNSIDDHILKEKPLVIYVCVSSCAN